MKIFNPFYIAIRVILYSLIVFGVAEIIFYDAQNPMEGGYFGEITLTEIMQEILLFILFVFYLVLGFKRKHIQPVSNVVSLFFLISFIREFNFLIDGWVYPAILVLMLIVYLVIRDYKRIKQATIHFFEVPASSWFFSGFLVTFIFSRLFGRSKFWRLLYDEEHYRLAKAATEEGLELLGNTLMLIAAIEFVLYYFVENRKHFAEK